MVHVSSEDGFYYVKLSKFMTDFLWSPEKYFLRNGHPALTLQYLHRDPYNLPVIVLIGLKILLKLKDTF